MKNIISLFLIIVSFSQLNSQYTETINSNRPGSSQGAFSVGKNVLQFEIGIGIGIKKSEQNLNYYNKSNNELNYNIRYGLISNKLEFFINGLYIENKIHSDLNGYLKKESIFGNQKIGLKYLIFDPFKNKKWHSVNLLSWKKNRSLRLVDLIPAISGYAAINYIPNSSTNNSPIYWLINNFYSYNQNSINSKIGIITQNHFLGKWVLVNQFSYDKIGDSNKVFNHIITLTHNFINPRWSSFVEYEINKLTPSLIKNHIYTHNYFKFGGAYLLNKDFQFDSGLGINLNSTNNFNISFGFSTRLDWYKDEVPVNKKELKANKKRRKKNKKSIKKDYNLTKKQDKINKKFDKKEKRLIKKNNRKNKK